MRNFIISVLFSVQIFSYAQSDKLSFFLVPKTSLKISEFAKTYPHFDNYRTPILDTGYIKVDSFEISTQVTLKLYKAYLADMKHDSSEAYYKKQFPDTTICTKEVYQKYLSNPEFESDPVVGITWLCAINFCKWLTLKDFTNDSSFRYRLPEESEWIFAYNYLKSNPIIFENKLSDWTYDAYDESVYNFAHGLSFNYVYFAYESDPTALKRKRTLGNSYLSNHINLYQYQFRGLKDLGFRVVKVNCTKGEKVYIKGEKRMFTPKAK